LSGDYIRTRNQLVVLPRRKIMKQRTQNKLVPSLTSALGSSELQVLDIIWHTGGATVREVFEEVHKTRNITLPAVMLSMNRLAKRGVLNKLPGERGATYQPLVSRHEMATSLLGDLVEKVLQGSVRPVLSSFVERLNDRELAELLELVNRRRDS
jgi:predicted transcriptional regulator